MTRWSSLLTILMKSWTSLMRFGMMQSTFPDFAFIQFHSRTSRDRSFPHCYLLCKPRRQKSLLSLWISSPMTLRWSILPSSGILFLIAPLKSWNLQPLKAIAWAKETPLRWWVFFLAMMKVRSDKDIANDKFQALGDLREETIESPDKSGARNEMGDVILVNFIKEFHDHEEPNLYYIAWLGKILPPMCTPAVFISDEWQHPCGSLPSWWNMQAEEVSQESTRWFLFWKRDRKNNPLNFNRDNLVG